MFCQRRVSAQEHREKRTCFRIFLITNSLILRGGQCKTVWPMVACEDYKVTKKFDKVY